ncbi:unnamed protein product, partial [Vitis vinifera]
MYKRTWASGTSLYSPPYIPYPQCQIRPNGIFLFLCLMFSSSFFFSV